MKNQHVFFQKKNSKVATFVFFAVLLSLTFLLVFDALTSKNVNFFGSQIENFDLHIHIF